MENIENVDFEWICFKIIVVNNSNLHIHDPQIKQSHRGI